jgi:hypothetical protein
MHVSGGISLEIVNIGAFLIHLGQEKVSFFDSFRQQQLKFFNLLLPGLQYMAGTCVRQCRN